MTSIVTWKMVISGEVLKKYYSCLLVSVLVQIDRTKVPIEQDRSWFARVQGNKKTPEGVSFATSGVGHRRDTSLGRGDT